MPNNKWASTILRDLSLYGCGCLALALGASLSGCYVGGPLERMTSPLYRDRIINMPSADASSGYSGGANRSVVVPAFIDKRPNRSRIGMQKNSFGEYTSNLLTLENINEWLALRLGNELKAAGFQIEGSGESARAATIQGFTRTLFIEPLIHWTRGDVETDLSVLIQVSRPDGLVAERRYYVKGVYMTAWGSDDSYALSLRQAMDMLMKRVVADIVNLLNRFPKTELQL